MNTCPHLDFEVFARVVRIEDRGEFCAEVQVRCSQCRVRFRFLGLPAGLAPDRPKASVDGFELRAPITPDAHLTSLMAGAGTGWPAPEAT